MKTIKTSLFFILFSMLSTVVFSQNTSEEIHQKMGKTLDQLSQDQLVNVLNFATFLSNGKKSTEQEKKAKASIAKILKKLPLNEQQQMLDFAIMEKYGFNKADVAKKSKSKSGMTVPEPSVHAHDHPKKATPTVPTAPVGPTTMIEFAEKEFDFGVIEEGEKVSYVYKFTNTGLEPLIIKAAKGSCGCTVPKWTKEPIAPGETGEMLVEFNSRGKSGMQNKRVTITANTNPAQTFINIKGEVLKKK